MKFYEKLQLVIREKKWSQKKLAEETGLSARTISRWMKEKTIPEWESIKQIADATGYNASWLYEDDYDGPALQGAEKVLLPINKSISDRIKQAREAAGLSQEQLADKTFSTLLSVIGYEKGHRTVDADFLNQFVEVTGCDPGWLITGKTTQEIMESTGTSNVVSDKIPSELQLGFEALFRQVIQGKLEVGAFLYMYEMLNHPKYADGKKLPLQVKALLVSDSSPKSDRHQEKYKEIKSQISSDIDKILDRDTGQELLNDLAYLSENDRKAFYQMATDVYRMVEKIKNPEKNNLK